MMNIIFPSQKMAAQAESKDLVGEFQDVVNATYDLEGSPENVKYTQELNTQKAREMELITQFMIDGGTCPANVNVKDVVMNLAKLDVSKITNLQKDEFYSGELMKAIACLANAIVLDMGPNSLASNERIREYFGSFQTIGGKTSSGIALSGSIAGQENYLSNMFILKIPREKETEAEIIHECIVAFKGTNRLRSLGIPNFAYVYGAFFCSPPILNEAEPEKHQVFAYCNSNKIKACPYVIYENISGSSFWNYFDSSLTLWGNSRIREIQEIMDYYLQTLVALQCAYEKCNFTHYDLTGSNLIIRKTQDTPFLIQYPTSLGTGDDVYVYSPGGIATFIDYGRSHITADGEDYGTPENIAIFNIFRDRSYPLYDAYQLFTTVLFLLKKYDRTKVWYDSLCSLLVHFEGIVETNITNPNWTFEIQLYNNYILPPETSPEKNLIWWIQICRDWCNKMGLRDPIVNETKRWIVYPNLRLLGEDGEIVENEVLRLAGVLPIESVPQARTYSEFYDLYGRFSDEMPPERFNEYKQGLIDRFTESKNFEMVMTREQKKVDRLISTLSTIYNTSFDSFTPSATPFPSDLTQLFTDQYLLDLKSSMVFTSIFLNTYQRLEMSSRAVQRAVDVIGATHPEAAELLTKITAALTLHKERRNLLSKTIRSNINLLDHKNPGNPPTVNALSYALEEKTKYHGDPLDKLMESLHCKTDEEVETQLCQRLSDLSSEDCSKYAYYWTGYMNLIALVASERP